MHHRPHRSYTTITRIDRSWLAHFAHDFLSSLVRAYPTDIVLLVLDEMFSAIIRSIRVTAAVLEKVEEQGCHSPSTTPSRPWNKASKKASLGTPFAPSISDR
jgi:hypothetical protein